MYIVDTKIQGNEMGLIPPTSPQVNEKSSLFAEAKEQNILRG